jgi:hypothetical protein
MAAEDPKKLRAVIPNVALEVFEKAVYTGDLERAGTLMHDMIVKLKTGAGFIHYSADPRIAQVLYTRACAAIVALLMNPKFELSSVGFNTLAAEHATIDLLFRASAFGTSDHMLPLVSKNENAPSGELQFEAGPMLVKYLLTHSLRSGFALNYRVTFSRSPDATFALWAGMLAALVTTNAVAQKRREELLEVHDVFENCLIPTESLSTISDAFMYTSYGLRADKHEAKRTISRLFAKTLRHHNVPLPTPEELAARWDALCASSKPLMVVGLEAFGSVHAMYRVYAPIMRQLRRKFYLIGISRESEIDDDAKREFDEWREIPAAGAGIADITRMINEIAPMVMYYPSIGMAVWWVALSSVRLAPLQIMTLGHPATSGSPEIDFVLAEENTIGDHDLFVEPIRYWSLGANRFVMRDDADLPEPRIPELREGPVKVAIPSMVAKLNFDFLELLKKAADETETPIEYHFFPNQIGLTLFQTAAEIRDVLPTARIYERSHYNQYMRQMRECDFMVVTYPFGNTNSTLDALHLGLPVLTLRGNECHSRYDSVMLQKAGLPEFLIADTPGVLIEKIAVLADNEVYRWTLAEQVRSVDLQAVFYGDPPNPTEIVDLVDDLLLEVAPGVLE